MLGFPFFLAFFGGTRLGMYCTFVHQALRCYDDQGMRRLALTARFRLYALLKEYCS